MTQKTNWFLLLILCFVQIGTTCDTSILSNCTAAMMSSFHASLAEVQLANIICPLMSGSFMILGGVLGLKWGWKRLLFVGLVLMTLAEFLAGMSHSLSFFTFGARVLQGVGGSFAIPAALGLIIALVS